jgi:phage terminase small subunit
VIKFKKNIRLESRKEALRLQEEYDIQDEGGILLLQIFADCDSTMRSAQEIVDSEGLHFEDRFGQKKAHPLLTVIRDARAQKMAALKNLCLDVEPLRDKPGRPAGGR